MSLVLLNAPKKLLELLDQDHRNMAKGVMNKTELLRYSPVRKAEVVMLKKMEQMLSLIMGSAEAMFPAMVKKAKVAMFNEAIMPVVELMHAPALDKESNKKAEVAMFEGQKNPLLADASLLAKFMEMLNQLS